MATTKDAGAAPAVQHGNVYEALAAFQLALPPLTKDSTAKVPTKSGGSYEYSYADLSLLVNTLLPKLAEHGIAWVCVPNVEENGFMLRYGLYHGASDTKIEGVYALPRSGTPQEIGSAITYARRYTLLCLTGTFPAGEDDDGQKASDAYRARETRQAARDAREAREAAQAAQRGQRQGGKPDGAAAPATAPAAAAGPAPAAGEDEPLVADSDRINSADTIEALRGVYRDVAAAKQLDRILPTGEAVRDAITARQVQLAAAAEAAPSAQPEPDQPNPEPESA